MVSNLEILELTISFFVAIIDKGYVCVINGFFPGRNQQHLENGGGGEINSYRLAPLKRDKLEK